MGCGGDGGVVLFTCSNVDGDSDNGASVISDKVSDGNGDCVCNYDRPICDYHNGGENECCC